MKTRNRLLIGCLLLLFLIPLFSLLPAGAAVSEGIVAPIGQGIKIMSYNVMDDCSPNSNGVFPYDSPANREDAIVQMLKAYGPDVIGMQEAGDGGVSGILDWCSALDEDLKDTYAHRSLTDETGYKMDICRGLIIFYRKARFTLLDSGAKGYSQPANNKRCYQWVKLRDNQTNAEFYVFNTHWHVDGKLTLEENEVIRTSQMQELADKVNTLAKDQRAFITGDFNSFYSPKNSMGDTVNITRLQEATGFVDALLSTSEMHSINGAGTKTALQSDDKGLMTSADHVVYPPEFYAPVKLERILSRTFTPKLSDHDAFLVYFSYKMPELTAKAGEERLDAYFSNGAYYIDYLKRGTKDVPIQVELSKGEIYTDAACSQSAGTDLVIKNGQLTVNTGRTYETYLSGSIVDNYFHLTQKPTYTDSSGNTVNYTNRGITMRNMKDMAIHGNYFDGYTGNKIRPFWLSSEVSDRSTVAVYGNLDLTGNRFESSTSGSLYINNIRDDTSANILIAGNSYGGEKVIVDFRETGKQGTQKLPTDKSKITFSVNTEDYPNLTILPR